MNSHDAPRSDAGLPRHHGLATRAVHAGEPRPPILGAVAMPIFQSSTFVSDDDRAYHDIRYMRLSNTPSHEAVGAKIAALEGTESALVTASGMAAITSALLAHLESGDHVIAQSCLYGGTLDFLLEVAPRFGIETTFVSLEDPGSWEAARRPRTRVFYVESVTNPLCEVGRLDEAARFAREHGLVAMIDSTFTSPVNFRPAEFGYDLVLHSATKYLNGHSDVIAGVVAGPTPTVTRVREQLNILGGSLDSLSCYLLLRGLKTLPLRVQQQSASARVLAAALDSLSAVARVHYPALPGTASAERVARWFATGGGMLSFLPAGGRAAADRILERLTIPLVAPSLGGPETLVCRPAATSHQGLSRADREVRGIDDALIRVSLGLETTEDLVADFERAITGGRND